MEQKRKAQEGRFIGALLRIPHNAFVARIYKGVIEDGYTDFTAAHLTVFQHIDVNVGSHLTWLAERALMTKQSMGYLVDHLESCGYVERVSDPQDGRAKVVRLTARGHGVMESARRTATQIEVEWAEIIGADKMKELKDILKELVIVLE
jgi:DNA-binding MarR family transcriptional regulator